MNMPSLRVEERGSTLADECAKVLTLEKVYFRYPVAEH
jgi:hypothetical protein